MPENVTGLPELHVMAWDVGLTELVGAKVFCTILNVCVFEQPDGLTPVTDQVPTASLGVKIPRLPVCGADIPLVQV